MHSFDLRDYDKTEHLFAAEGFDAVIHFAGFKAVGESVEKPLDYYENNLGSTFSLVRAMQRYDVDKLVFSSSATVYGTDQAGATEDRPTFATNPYGWTKVMQEQILADVANAAPHMRVALLRYFNPVGAHASGTIGEDPSGTPNNLMPYLAQVAVGQARQAAASSATTTTPSTAPACATTSTSRTWPPATSPPWRRSTTTAEPVNTWNLGSGHGTSVLELLHAFEKAVGRELPLRGRRPPSRRRRVVVRRPVQGQPRARLEHHPVGRGDVRRHVALAVAEPRGVHELMLASLGLSVGLSAASALLPLAGTTVVVDPGHQLGNVNFPAQINRPVPAGGFTKPCNTTGTATDGGYPEATLTWQVSRVLRARLTDLGARVVMTRTSNRDGPLGAVRRRPRSRRQPHQGRPQDQHPRRRVVRRRRPRLPRHRPRLPGRRGPTTSPGRRWPWPARCAPGWCAPGCRSATYVAGGDGLDVRSDLATLNLSDVPTVMVELGNMRDPGDARRMTTARGRAAYASALLAGIRRFLR